MNFDHARKIADAVLYEGYVLYPYRASSAKNRLRWQFGIVAPREWSTSGSDPWEMQTECLIEPTGNPALDVTIRFLQIQLRDPAPGAWEDGVERTIELHALPVRELASVSRDVPFEMPGDSAIVGLIRLSAAAVDGFLKLRVRIENHTPFPDAALGERSAAMRCSLVGAHTLLGVTGGAFISLMDPPARGRSAAQACSNLHTWPVLAGERGSRDVMLSAPIILEDFPAIAPESRHDFYDATEIDELLTLRVMTLTDDEKREAAAGDERARQIIEQCDTIPPEIFERLHGATRSLDQPAAAERFFNPTDEIPESAVIQIDGQNVSRGSRVRLAPKRRADSMDLFLAGRTAVVAGVHHDLEDRVYVAVTVEDDPAADIQGRVGRFFYFYPDELELIGKEN